MADDKQPSADQAELAKEVLAGKREITASVPMPIPDHVKAQADTATADLNKTEIKMAEAGPPVAEKADPYDVKGMEAQREQQRQNALDNKTPDPTQGPDKG
jgi:hypothetical protein